MDQDGKSAERKANGYGVLRIDQSDIVDIAKNLYAYHRTKLNNAPSWDEMTDADRTFFINSANIAIVGFCEKLKTIMDAETTLTKSH